MSSFIFWSLFSDQRDRHVDLEVSVEMYSHCISYRFRLSTGCHDGMIVFIKEGGCSKEGYVYLF